jgi:uncharacterized protein (TIGR00255 family)
LIRSMTGFGRAEWSQDGKIFVAEIRTVNNRFRDVILRLPKALQSLEDEIRSLVASRIKRGRVEVSVQIEMEGEESYALELNVPLATSYLRVIKELSDHFGLENKVNPLDLCQLKDIILFRPEEQSADEVRAGIQEVISRALESCDSMRIQEGKAIEQDLIKRIMFIRKCLEEIEARTSLVVEDYRRKLRERIERLTNEIQLDESRLVQEVAVFADRCDITEEISRARSHLDQFTGYLSAEDSVGRKLDFLLQEINREINTMSAKASDSPISFKVVEMKAELEKLREQVQNVE